MADDSDNSAPLTRHSWNLVQKMLSDVTEIVMRDAESEAELAEGLRVVAKVSALCAQLSVEADPDHPHFFDMCTPTRMVGGPNPDGSYHLAMIDGTRAYRVTGTRGTTAYLGLQVLAGTGLTPRRMAAYVSDTELPAGAFTLVFSHHKPADIGDSLWIEIPEDASSIVVREYIADPTTEVPATLDISAVELPPPTPVTDAAVADQFTAMAWTILKLTTLHRTIAPELLSAPNTLITAEAAALGTAETTPDNLYMLGMFRLEPDQTLLLKFEAPQTRYWNVALENIWHECIEPRRRHSSVTNKGVTPDADGVVRIAISAGDFGYGHWLDTGGRHRGFVVVRWLDNPAAPTVEVTLHKGDNA
ncbi:DUF1214 domain-containing protein [Mycobacterium sp. MS1601]|uniref:DUF1214 domain-containing protein n=1 Tax=Mycobacterium sp. MS1601 TaxID=1936029 RepID=UPI001F202867|nr:DUF1214 domain-containing protein [Mycobacterium sp. MS1601]